MKQGRRKIMLFIGATALIALGAIACGRSFGSGDRTEHLLKHMDRKVSSLDLTEPQQLAYNQMRAAIKTDLESLQSERKDTARKIKAELSASAPDMKKVASFAKEGLRKHPDIVERQIDRLTEFYGKLNEDQQKEVRELIEKRLSRFDS